MTEKSVLDASVAESIQKKELSESAKLQLARIVEFTRDANRSSTLDVTTWKEERMVNHKGWVAQAARFLGVGGSSQESVYYHQKKVGAKLTLGDGRVSEDISFSLLKATDSFDHSVARTVTIEGLSEEAKYVFDLGEDGGVQSLKKIIDADPNGSEHELSYEEANKVLENITSIDISEKVERRAEADLDRKAQKALLGRLKAGGGDLERVGFDTIPQEAQVRDIGTSGSQEEGQSVAQTVYKVTKPNGEIVYVRARSSYGGLQLGEEDVLETVFGGEAVRKAKDEIRDNLSAWGKDNTEEYSVATPGAGGVLQTEAKQPFLFNEPEGAVSGTKTESVGRDEPKSQTEAVAEKTDVPHIPLDKSTVEDVAEAEDNQKQIEALQAELKKVTDPIAERVVNDQIAEVQKTDDSQFQDRQVEVMVDKTKIVPPSVN